MANRLPVTVIIITLNEADRLPRALESVAWAAEIVVVDAGSTDATCALARAAGAVVVTHAWEGYSAQKQFALERARQEWVLWIDADEVVTPRLARAIAGLLAAGPEPRCAAYAVKRRTFYLGRCVRFGGWYPDRKVRLFRRDRARFDGRGVHEGLRVAGTIGRLEGELLHYSFRDLEHHVRKSLEHARLWSEERRAGRRVRTVELLVRPLAKVVKSYFWRGGFLEGWRGLVIAGISAWSVWLKYALLRERQAGLQEGRGDGSAESRRA